jgi:queuine tRNA-ribosyltransferase
MYKLLKKTDKARRGELHTQRGVIQTPCFMPIATKANIKAISVEDVKALNPDIILNNTYHLMLRPGKEELQQLGGSHKFMNWEKPILTDSGGFQIFSLANIRKMTEDGVTFNSHINGKEFFMKPEDSIDIQMAIDSDIMMVLDECVELPATREYLEKSVALTTRWATRCKEHFERVTSGTGETSETRVTPVAPVTPVSRPLLFGIIQGGTEKDLRIRSAKDLTALNFDGYSIGGLAVGETEQEMYSVLDYITDEIPEDKPRYLMGVGYPHQIVEAVKRGVDMFDCVIPTREARHGRMYILKNDQSILNSGKAFYETTNIKLEKHKFDQSPINPNSQFAELRNTSKAFLRHLFVSEDASALRLTTLNNIEFYLEFMRRLRAEIS